MVKECLVTLNNEAVTVVKFDNIDIQFPSIHKNEKTVFVKFEDGKYSIVDKPDGVIDTEIKIEKPAVKTGTKKRNKKTTNENA